MKWNLTICGLSLRWCVQGPFMLYHSLVLHSFVLPNNIPLFTHFVYPFSRWRVFGLFSFFGYYAISFCVHSYTGFCMDIVFQFLGCVLRSVIAESFCNLLSQICNLLLNILRNYCIVFHRGCTIVLPSSVYKGSNFSMSLKVFAIFCFLFIAILLCVKWYFSIVLICISLMANDVE